MLDHIGFQALAESYGLLNALIPFLITGIVIGLLGAFGNERLYGPTPERTKKYFKARMTKYRLSLSGILFLCGWYGLNFQVHWLTVGILLFISLAITIVFIGDEAIIDLNRDGKLDLSLASSFTYVFVVLLVTSIFFMLQDVTGLNEKTLDKQEKKVYYIQNNDLKAFDQVDLPVDIDPLHRLRIYLHNLDKDSIQTETILLARDLQRSERYHPQLTSLIYGVEAFTRSQYKTSQTIFKNAGKTQLADLSKVLTFLPLLTKTKVQNNRDISDRLKPRAKELIVERLSSLISKNTPELSNAQYISNFKWRYWKNLMRAGLVLSISSVISLVIGANIVRISQKTKD